MKAAVVLPGLVFKGTDINKKSNRSAFSHICSNMVRNVEYDKILLGKKKIQDVSKDISLLLRIGIHFSLS